MEESLRDRVDAVDIPGQMGLPGTGAPRIQALGNAKHEDFCQEYVANGNNGRAAYRKCVNPQLSDNVADSAASRLLRSVKVEARIIAIREELRKKWAVSQDDILEFHGRVLKTDRRKFFDDTGHRIPVHLLDDDLAAIIDLESTYSKDAGIVMLPAVASKAKSAEAMAKMMGLEKNKVELTGKDGAPIETNATITIYIPGNDRDVKE